MIAQQVRKDIVCYFFTRIHTKELDLIVLFCTEETNFLQKCVTADYPVLNRQNKKKVAGDMVEFEQRIAHFWLPKPNENI